MPNIHSTIFDTSVINAILRWCSVAFLKIAGWKVSGAPPPEPAG
jgi:hypothetical protein